ncbi:MAG: hydrogenase maturation nickel metallochaperone HypA [Candidatus Cloacimonadaceae bacterium]|nr:hydrogenase maturation nickel metallochaperone HypA [Candidatus Cloacimonadaceae bacterium]MDP3113421.1 hydrogenase maturation nickel metallochaperone HypA [Candidatus Cloacimonadaceae bacterium]
MHEGAIVKSLLEIANQYFLEADLTEVTKVNVIIGKFHHIVNEVLQMHFDLMKKDTAGFEQAILEIEERDLVIKCRKCDKTTNISEICFSCPDCDSIDTELIQGNELHIASIEGTEDT